MCATHSLRLFAVLQREDKISGARSMPALLSDGRYGVQVPGRFFNKNHLSTDQNNQYSPSREKSIQATKTAVYYVHDVYRHRSELRWLRAGVPG